MIFESHAHYDDKAFDQDRDDLLLFLKNRGIDTIINVGADLESTKRTVEMTEQYSFVYGAAGVHPSDISCLNEEGFLWLKEQLAKEKIVALGEIGLDYYWEKEESQRELQKFWFHRQLELAKEAKFPVIIHSRDAAKDTLDILKEEKYKELNGVIHCYSYGTEMAREYLKLGYFFGIGGVVTFSNAKKLKEVVEMLPLERILLETDAPYLSPVPNRGKRNDSANLEYVAEEIARIKQIDVETVVNQTRINGFELFSRIGKKES